MFVHVLPPGEKQALVSLIASIARAAGSKKTSPEASQAAAFAQDYAQQHGVSITLDPGLSIEAACADIQSHKGKVVAIQEVIRLALAEGHYDDAEKEGVLVIAGLLNISLKKCNQIERWVKEGYNWVRRGEELLSDA